MPTFNLKLNNTPFSNFKQSNALNKTLVDTKDNLKLEKDNLELEKEDNPKVLFYYQLLSVYTEGAESEGYNNLNSIFNNPGLSTLLTLCASL